MKIRSTTLLVLGGGPGGYVAAIRAGQLGIPTVLVEARALGGTCLNIGCIPSKALIHAADEFDNARRWAAGPSPLGIQVESPRLEIGRTVAWKDGIVARLTGGVGQLLRKQGVQVVRGRATIVDGKTVDVRIGEGGGDGSGSSGGGGGRGGSGGAGGDGQGSGDVQRIQCEHLLLATGSVPVELPSLPFGEAVVSSTEALSPTELPRRLVVVGAGYIGLELGFAYRKLGAEVTVVEAADRVLPGYDEALTKPVLAALKRHGVVLHLGCSVEGLAEAVPTTGRAPKARVAVRVRTARADEFALPADRVLVAVGRRPATAGYGLESLQLAMQGRAVRIDAECRTSMRNVWAIGDLTGEPMLAHRAMAQGETVAELIAGHRRRFEPMAIPAVCFTDPEVVVVGHTPATAAEAGLDVVEGQFPFAANGRALTLESGDGFVRVVARRDNQLIVGWQAVGRQVSELATAFGLSLEMGARLEDVGGTIHAHPTLGEAVQEAALRALGRALHA